MKGTSALALFIMAERWMIKGFPCTPTPWWNNRRSVQCREVLENYTALSSRCVQVWATSPLRTQLFMSPSSSLGGAHWDLIVGLLCSNSQRCPLEVANSLREPLAGGFCASLQTWLGWVLPCAVCCVSLASSQCVSDLLCLLHPCEYR